MALYNPARIDTAAELRRQELLAEVERERRNELATRSSRVTPDDPVEPAGPADIAAPPRSTVIGRLRTGWKAMTASSA